MPPPLETGLDASCTVCGGCEGRTLCTKHGFDVVVCGCGGAFLSPPPGEVDHTIEGHTAAFYALGADTKLDWLEQSCAPGRLLEVGCGYGYFLEAARARGYEVAGVEMHEGRARATRERLGVEVEHAPIEETALPPQSFDVVYHCDLLSHFPKPAVALRAMASLLRVGGVLFFDVGLHAEEDLRLCSERTDLCVPRHRWFYSRAAVERLLDGAGLRVVRHREFSLRAQIFLGDVARALVPTTPWRSRLGEVGAYRETHRPGPYTLHERARNFMRYGVGGAMPWLGPKTGLFIVERKT